MQIVTFNRINSVISALSSTIGKQATSHTVEKTEGTSWRRKNVKYQFSWTVEKEKRSFGVSESVSLTCPHNRVENSGQKAVVAFVAAPLFNIFSFSPGAGSEIISQ